jgi:hypothetical protein
VSTRTDTALRRWLRWFTLGSGPLKRGSDRLQVAGRLVVVLALLIAPPLAVAATAVTTAHLEARAAEQAAERTHVDAVLLEDAPQAPEGADTSYGGGEERVTVPARAVWPVRGRAQHRGVVLVRPGTAAGTTVPVWVDRAGHITLAPLDRSRIDTSATTIGTVIFLGVPLGTWTLSALLCTALDAHRERRWARGWAAVESDWVTRLL